MRFRKSTEERAVDALLEQVHKGNFYVTPWETHADVVGMVWIGDISVAVNLKDGRIAFYGPDGTVVNITGKEAKRFIDAVPVHRMIWSDWIRKLEVPTDPEKATQITVDVGRTSSKSRTRGRSS